MDVLIPILACSLYLEDDALVRAIAESNSQSNPFAVLDAAVDPTEVDAPPPPKSIEAALTRASDITQKGGRPLLGLMQLPPTWLEAFGRPLREAFEPCTNIAIGTAMLSEFEYECAEEAPARSAHGHASAGRGASSATPSAIARRPCILRKYAAAIDLPDFVMLTSLELRYQRPFGPDVASAPIFANDGAHGSWGPQDLLVHASPGPLLSPSIAPSP